MAFGEMIRKARETKGWTQTDLGNHLSKSQAWIHLVETGQLSIREDLRERLMNVLRLSTSATKLHLHHARWDAHKRVTRDLTTRRPIALFKLQDATPQTIEDLIEQSPTYEVCEIREFLHDAQGAIHQIPKVLLCEGARKLNLKNIQAYFGRSSAGARGKGDNLYQRFQCGIKDREDTHGIILAVTSIKATTHLERFGIGYLEHLRTHNGLCISNATLYGKGNVGATEPGFLYMTFKICPQVEDYAQIIHPRQIAAAIPSLLKRLGVNELGTRQEVKDAISMGLQQANDPSHTGNLELKPFVWPTKPNRKCVSF